MVARKDDNIFGVIAVDKAAVLPNGVGGTGVPVGTFAALIGGQYESAAVHYVKVPGLAVADVLVQLQGLILGQYANGVNARVGAVGQGEVDDAVFAAEGDCRLGNFAGESIKPAALATCQQHRDPFFFLGHLVFHLLFRLYWFLSVFITLPTKRTTTERGRRAKNEPWEPKHSLSHILLLYKYSL